MSAGTYGKGASLSRAISWVLVAVIRLYQLALSPLLGAHCRFQPTCSEYCVQALRKRGVVMGLLLAAWRILRCNPFCRAGYDPVPERPGAGRSADATEPPDGT